MNDVENDVAQTSFLEKESSDSDNYDALDSGAAVSPNNLNTKDEEQEISRSFGVEMHRVGRFQRQI